MTFMSTDPATGELVPGGKGPWEQPWGFRCDECGRTLPYGCTIGAGDRRHSIDEARLDATRPASDRHVCGRCEGFTEQLGLFA